MMRRISWVCALLAIVALGFVSPARPQARTSAVATIGAVGISGAAPGLNARRPRAKIARADGRGDGGNPLAWSHLPWLLSTARAFAPERGVGALALVTPVAPSPSAAGATRTSRGPPSRS